MCDQIKKLCLFSLLLLPGIFLGNNPKPLNNKPEKKFEKLEKPQPKMCDVKNEVLNLSSAPRGCYILRPA